jgi:hypothetical protein
LKSQGAMLPHEKAPSPARSRVQILSL